jgi:hypothetical protein
MARDARNPAAPAQPRLDLRQPEPAPHGATRSADNPADRVAGDRPDRQPPERQLELSEPGRSRTRDMELGL